MSKIEENKIVDYGGTALSVVSLLVCLCFYPGVVAAKHSAGIIIALGGGEYLILIQFLIFAVVAGAIWGFCEAINEAQTRAEKRFGVIILLLIYVPTFMPFIKIVQGIYRDYPTYAPAF